MVRKCIAYGCSKSTNDGVSLFQFPKDDSLKRKWTKQVQRTRAGWPGACATTVLCCDHFEKDCLEDSCHLSATFGIKKLARLKPNAIPTIFPRPSSRQPHGSKAAAVGTAGCSGSKNEVANTIPVTWSNLQNEERLKKEKDDE